MEFNTFHNIKMEGGMVGWPVGGPHPPHSDKKVNPFMQWVLSNSVQGIYFAPGQGPGPAQTPPSDLSGGGGPASTNSGAAPASKQETGEQSRPASVTVTTEAGPRQVTNMAPAPGHYNHTTLHPMVPVDPGVGHHQQQPQQQHHQQHQHQHQQQQPPQQQQQQQQQSGEMNHSSNNDTAFPGGHHRQPGYGAGAQMIQNHVNNKIPGDKSTAASLTKNKLYTEENGQVVTFNGSQEHMEMTRRGVKIERVYECKDCDKAFTREEHLKRHAKSHTDEPVHRCEVVGCPKAYTRKERLTRHYKVAHLGQEPERPFFCGICGKDFQRKEHLTRHQKNLHGAGVPGAVLQQHNHQAQAQTGNHENHDTDGPISMTVLNPLSTNTHHSAAAPHPAGQTHAQAPASSHAAVSGHGAHGQAAQQTHNRSHNPEGLLHCSYEGCPKTYSRREHLNRHIKLHMGIEPERPYYCMECGKTFTRKEHLMRHRRSHTGETPFACPGADCNKQFARKEHLKRHMRVHTGEHPYPCTECGRSFGRRERLLKHLKSHGIGVMHGVRPQYQPQQPKKIEFKKEPEFNAEFSDEHNMSHGVFGDQANHLLRMIATKGPISPDQLGPGAPAPPAAEPVVTQQVFSNPEVARALSNPEIVRAFSNPDVVKAFALSPPKKSATSPGGTHLSQATLTTVQVSQAGGAAAAPAVTRGPDIANSPSVPPELSKLPSGFSIFPVVPSSGAAAVQAPAQDQGQVMVTNSGGGTYYQAGAGPGYSLQPHLAAWPGWHVTSPSVQPVNMSSPAKQEPGAGDQPAGKHWPEPATALAQAAYFRAPFP